MQCGINFITYSLRSYIGNARLIRNNKWLLSRAQTCLIHILCSKMSFGNFTPLLSKTWATFFYCFRTNMAVLSRERNQRIRVHMFALNDKPMACPWFKQVLDDVLKKVAGNTNRRYRKAIAKLISLSVGLTGKTEGLGRPLLDWAQSNERLLTVCLHRQLFLQL